MIIRLKNALVEVSTLEVDSNGYLNAKTNIEEFTITSYGVKGLEFVQYNLEKGKIPDFKYFNAWIENDDK